MKKNTIRGVIGIGILLILYILIAFLIPFKRTAVFWLSFAFTLIAFAVTAVSLYIAFIKNPDAKSKFYGFPIAKIGVIYFVVQLIVGLVLMAIGKWVPIWLAVILYAVILGTVVIGLISADAVVDQIHVQDEKLKKNISMMRSIQSKLNQMAADCDEPALKKLADEVRYSDPVSSDGLVEIETELSSAVDELQVAVVDGDSASVNMLCRKISSVLSERNRLCKLNKQ